MNSLITFSSPKKVLRKYKLIIQINTPVIKCPLNPSHPFNIQNNINEYYDISEYLRYIVGELEIDAVLIK